MVPSTSTVRAMGTVAIAATRQSASFAVPKEPSRCARTQLHTEGIVAMACIGGRIVRHDRD